MTKDEKLKSLKIMTADPLALPLDDETLLIYLNIAKDKIISRAFPYSQDEKDIPSKYENLQLEMASYMINKRGAEGETAHNENGINRTYGDADIPSSMLNIIGLVWSEVIKPKIIKNLNKKIDEGVLNEQRQQYSLNLDIEQLHKELQNIVMNCEIKKYRSKYTTEHFCDVMAKYKKMGGNHDSEILENDLKKIPLKEIVEIPIDEWAEIQKKLKGAEGGLICK